MIGATSRHDMSGHGGSGSSMQTILAKYCVFAHLTGLHTEGGWPWNFPYPEKVFPPQQIFFLIKSIAVPVADMIAFPTM